MKGTVKWYNVKKGYGFIAGEDGTDYFFHWSHLKEDSKTFNQLSLGTTVEFKAELVNEKSQAKEIVAVD